MLKIFNDLQEFFKDNYRRISVREYARISKISPPSASKLLNNYYKEGILIKELDKNYILFAANRENKTFIELSRLYWFSQLKKSGILDYFEKELINPLVILFGSFSKAEITDDSDIDLAVFAVSNKSLNLTKYEEILKRKIHILVFKDYESVKNKDLLKNIFNGLILAGRW